MATIEGNLWEYNFARVLVVDVSDDYRLMQTPLPSNYYPVVKEMLLPRQGLMGRLSQGNLADGYLYDWHERPADDVGPWYVGVVDSALANHLM